MMLYILLTMKCNTSHHLTQSESVQGNYVGKGVLMNLYNRFMA